MLKFLAKFFHSSEKRNNTNAHLENLTPTGEKSLITVPEIKGESDFKVSEILIENEGKAAKGQVICSLESKSLSFELESFENAILRWKCKKGDIVKTGDEIVEIELIK